jgi:hypothetical protein
VAGQAPSTIHLENDACCGIQTCIEQLNKEKYNNKYDILQAAGQRDI